MHITLNGKKYTKDRISPQAEHLRDGHYSENERLTLEFIHDWQSEKSEFQIKTSGSTGTPKIITIGRNQMLLSARLTIAALQLQAGDNALVCLSPAYIGGLMMLVRGLVANLNLTIVEPTGNPFAHFGADLPNFDFTALAPLQMQNIMQSDPKYVECLNNMKAILIGGANVSVDLENAVKRIKAPVYHTFGMTETVSHIALRRMNGVDASEFYRALPGVKIGQDDRNCLTIQSELTGNQCLVTNDVVEIKQPDKFTWLGRIDNIINSGGVKVQAEKVEKEIAKFLLERNDASLEFFVGGLADEQLGEKVVAVFKQEPGTRFSTDDLINKLRGKLSKYEMPKEIYFVEDFIRTENGKINRKATLAVRRMSGVL